MKTNSVIAISCTGLLSLNLIMAAQESKKPGGIFRRIMNPNQAPSKSGYLNYGEPFSLRKAAPMRPPAYALPTLPITPDPQPLPLITQAPAQPLNPLKGGKQPTVIKLTTPSLQVPPIRSFIIRAQPTFVPRVMSGSGILPQQYPQNSFLNPEILRYFGADANGTYQSRLRLNSSSLFTLPTMNPLLQRGGSTTYQIK